MAEVPNPVAQTPEVQQVTFKHGEFRLPGLVVDDKDQLTHASMLDLLFTCMAALGNPGVDAILKANGIVIRDLDGKLFFPSPRK